MKLRIVSVMSLLAVLISCGEIYNFDTVLTDKITAASSIDSKGYYWKDYSFTPIYGHKYTITMTSNSNSLDFHVAESGSSIAFFIKRNFLRSFK